MGTKVLKRDDAAHEKAPKVMQEDTKPSSPKGSRPYSTTSRRKAQEMEFISSNTEVEALMGEPISPDTAEKAPKRVPISSSVTGQGHIFGLPSLPLPSKMHLKHRYDPVVHQVTNLLMESGKLSIAQRVRSSVHLFIARLPYRDLQYYNKAWSLISLDRIWQ